MPRPDIADRAVPVITDIAAIAKRIKGKNPIGEAPYAPVMKAMPPIERQNMLGRLFRSIDYLTKIAESEAEKHRDNPNHISRLSTNEFFFYTKEPLTLEEFANLQNQIAVRAKELHSGIQLILGSFAVLNDDGKVMNVTPHITCGDPPNFHFIIKNHTSPIDVSYKTPGTQTILKQLDRKTHPSPPKELPSIEVNGVDQYFTFNNIVRCKTPGETPFLTAVDICLDHRKGVAKDNMKAFADKTPEEADQPISHVVVSNCIELSTHQCIGNAVLHVDPDDSPIRCKAGVLQEAAQEHKVEFGKHHDNKPLSFDLFQVAPSPILKPSEILESTMHNRFSKAEDAFQRGDIAGTLALIPYCSDRQMGNFLNSLCRYNINNTDKNGYSLLHHIAASGRIGFFKQLLSVPDLDIDARCEHGTAIDVAALNNQQIIVVYLEDRQNEMLKARGAFNRGEINNLYKILSHWDSPSIQNFLKSHDVNKADRDGSTLLHMAAGADNLEFFKLLLSAPGLEIDTRSKQGTAKEVAQSYDSEQIIDFINKNKNEAKEALGKEDFQAVYHSLKNGGISLLDFFKSNDVNKCDECGNTLLHRAVLNGDADFINQLLRVPDIDIDMECFSGTARDIAVENNRLDIANLLKVQKKDVEEKIEKVVGIEGINKATQVLREGDTLALYHLLKKEGISIQDFFKSGDVNTADEDGFTLLLHAVLKNDVDFINQLLRVPDIDIDIKTWAGTTAKEAAIEEGNQNIADLLTAWEKNVEKKNDEPNLLSP